MGSLYLPIMEVLFVFLQDSLTLRKELLCKAHHPFAYYLAKTVSVRGATTILCIARVTEELPLLAHTHTH